MMSDEYYTDIEKLYKTKKDADIYDLLAFHEKYNGKLTPCHIPDLLKLMYGYSAISEQNDVLLDMIGTIIKTHGQEAIDIIVKRTNILIEEGYGEHIALSLILSVILFYNSKIQLDIVTPIITAEKPIREIYRQCIQKKTGNSSKNSNEILQKILYKLNATE